MSKLNTEHHLDIEIGEDELSEIDFSKDATYRGREFKNIKIEEILKVFGIKRSLSKKGSPYDNAVSEAVNKVMKTELIYQENFTNFQELNLKLAEYVYWYNNLRIHGSLGYKTPVEYRKAE